MDTPAEQNALAEQFGSDSRLVFLQTQGLTPGTKYVVEVSNVQDQDQTPNTIAAAPPFSSARRC